MAGIGAESLSAGIVLISHDRRLLEKLSRSIVWLDRGQTRRLDQGFAHFEAWRDEVLEQEERDFHKLGRQIAREEDWLRYGVTARRKRNVKRVAGLAALRQAKREHNHQAAAAKMGAADAATLRQAGGRGRGCLEILRRPADREEPHDCGCCAATGWALSGRTAPASRPC